MEENFFRRFQPEESIQPVESRPGTPPQQLIQTVDPSTPRKGDKRMSKDELAQVLPPLEVLPVAFKQYLIEKQLCGLCVEDHRGKKCRVSMPKDRAGLDKLIIEIVRKIEKREKPVTGGRRRTSQASSSKAAQQQAEPVIMIPKVCTKCGQAGHFMSECPRSDCAYCKSKEHVSTRCPWKKNYGYESK